MAPRTPRVVIIGCGMSAIALAIRMRKELGLETFQIYERNASEGGTWQANTYPGCACDIPSHWYSLSTELNPNWSQKYSSQPEIKAYWNGVFKKHNLASKTQFSTTFISASWDDERSFWTITLCPTNSRNDTFQVEAEFLVSAAGGLSNPSFQKHSIQGLDEFEGAAMHTAKYDHSVSLSNKKVALVGSGCSAAQTLPVISKDPTCQIYNFSRTPSWVVPRDNFAYSDTIKWMFRYIPGFMRAYRNFLIFTGDLRWLGFLKTMAGPRGKVQELALKRMRQITPPEYHEALTPKYPLGCKRVILDPGYYEALAKPNVHLIPQGVSGVTKKGLRASDGSEHEFDVIIFATGFDLTSESIALDLTAHGKKLSEVWNSKDGPQAYLGTSTASFPNFVTLLGPNVASGHYSVLSSSEMQVTMILNLLKPLVKQGVKSLEVKETAEDAYNKEIHSRLENTVFMSCKSYYRVNQDGKNTSTRPGFYFEYWWRTRRIKWDRYIQKGGSISLANRQRAESFGFYVACIGALASLVWAYSR